MRVLSLLQRSLCVVGRLGRGKKKARDGRAAIAIFRFFFLFMRYSAGAYAEEKVEGQLSRRLLTKKQLNLPLVCNKVD